MSNFHLGAVDHSSNLAQDISALYLNDEYSDVVLQVSGQTLPVHKLILATRSQYFSSILFGPCQESTQAEFEIKDTNLRAFKVLLKYIYTGRVNLSSEKEEDIVEILLSAHQYGFEDLESAICNYLEAALCEANIFVIYEMASVYNLTNLKERCECFIGKNSHKIFKHKEFSLLSPSALKAIVSRDSFFPLEDHMFQALYKWMEHNTEITEEQTKEIITNLNTKRVLKMRIKDGHCTYALAILKHWKRLPSLEEIWISLSSDGILIPELEALLDEVSTRECYVKLHLDHHWRNLKDGSHLMKVLLRKGRRCRVVELRTHVEDPSLVPPESGIVYLGLSTDNGERMLRVLRQREWGCSQPFCESCSDDCIEDAISIHFSLRQYPHSLTPLPSRVSLDLYLSDASDGDTQRIVVAVRDMHPLDGQYFGIYFPRSSLTVSGAKSLIRQMGRERVRVGVGGLRLCSPSITTKEEEEELEAFSSQHLCCRFYLNDDENIWKKDLKC